MTVYRLSIKVIDGKVSSVPVAIVSELLDDLAVEFIPKDFLKKTKCKRYYFKFSKSQCSSSING